jgi:prepilin-type N-terminal cleavage/methylation domain-containing protein
LKGLFALYGWGVRRSDKLSASRANDRKYIRQAGFSLLELLIVIAVLVVLVTLYFGHGSSNNQQQQIRACGNNLQKIALTLQIYANDQSDTYPRAADARMAEDVLSVLIPRYSADTAIFICPGSKDSPLASGESFREGRISYAYYMGWTAREYRGPLLSDRQIDSNRRALGSLMFSPDGKPPANNPHKFGGNVLFTDASMQSSPPAAAFAIDFPTNVTLLHPKL